MKKNPLADRIKKIGVYLNNEVLIADQTVKTLHIAKHLNLKIKKANNPKKQAQIYLKIAQAYERLIGLQICLTGLYKLEGQQSLLIAQLEAVSEVIFNFKNTALETEKYNNTIALLDNLIKLFGEVQKSVHEAIYYLKHEHFKVQKEAMENDKIARSEIERQIENKQLVSESQNENSDDGVGFSKISEAEMKYLTAAVNNRIATFISTKKRHPRQITISLNLFKQIGNIGEVDSSVTKINTYMQTPIGVVPCEVLTNIDNHFWIK